MSIRILLPVPSSDPEYNQRSIAPYLEALVATGAEPVVIPAEATPAEIACLLATAQGVLLPGSRYDVEPERYGEAREVECGPADLIRAAMDELLLQDAFNQKKPVLGICQGCQSLNVWCGGKLVQDLKTSVNHRAGREVMKAHPIRIEPGSRLAAIAHPVVGDAEQVTSTHHQAIRIPGDRLQVVAVSPEDGVIEAVELASQEHFVLAVQWHPERSFQRNALSRAIFQAFFSEASRWKDRQIGGQHGER